MPGQLAGPAGEYKGVATRTSTRVFVRGQREAKHRSGRGSDSLDWVSAGIGEGGTLPDASSSMIPRFTPMGERLGLSHVSSRSVPASGRRKAVTSRERTPVAPELHETLLHSFHGVQRQKNSRARGAEPRRAPPWRKNLQLQGNSCSFQTPRSHGCMF